MADQHFLRLMKKYLKDYSIAGELHSDGYCSNFICRHQNDNYIVTIIAINPSLRNSISMAPNALTQFTSSSDFFIKNRYAIKPSTDLFSLADIESYKMWKNEYWVRKIEENKLIELAGNQTDVATTGEGYTGGWIPPFPPPAPTPDPRPLIRIPTWAAAVVLLAVVGFGFYKFMGDQPASYTDSQGNTVQTLSRNEMADAYTLGVQYYEQGNYENAIAELNKVTKKSGKYEEAQAAMAAAMAAYKDSLIEKAETYCTDGNFETALSLLEAGTALIGEDIELLAKEQEVLNRLKLFYIDKATGAEEKEEYAEAFSYIQTASAFLPDDIELKSLYTRLDAMSKAVNALSDAERYKAAKDYSKLFFSLDDAMDKVADSNVALSKLTLAYDEYKTEYLDEVEQQIKDPETMDEYSRAIETLDVAVKIFPDEYELKQKQESFQMMKAALDAVGKAEEYHKTADYINMFAVLENVMIEVKLHDEPYEKVLQTYNEYKNSYLSDLYEQIGEPKTVGEYESAISILEGAVNVLPDDNNLMSKLNYLIDNKPVDLFKQSLLSATKQFESGGSEEAGNAYQPNSEKIEDNIGNVYETGSYISDGWGAFHNYFTTEAVYDCAGYKTMSGTVAIAGRTKDNGGLHHFKILGSSDGEKYVLIASRDFKTGMRPWNFEELDISGYSNIKLALDTNDGVSYQELILTNFTLTK